MSSDQADELRQQLATLQNRYDTDMAQLQKESVELQKQKHRLENSLADLEKENREFKVEVLQAEHEFWTIRVENLRMDVHAAMMGGALLEHYGGNLEVAKSKMALVELNLEQAERGKADCEARKASYEMTLKETASQIQ